MTDFGQRPLIDGTTAAKQDLIIAALAALHVDVDTTIKALVDGVEAGLASIKNDTSVTLAGPLNDIETRLIALQALITISEVDSILNISVNDSTWQAIAVPAPVGSECKAIAATLLAETIWHFSHESDGDPSIKVNGTLTLDIVAERSTILGYAQTDSGSDTLQVVLLK